MQVILTGKHLTTKAHVMKPGYFVESKTFVYPGQSEIFIKVLYSALRKEQFSLWRNLYAAALTLLYVLFYLFEKTNYFASFTRGITLFSFNFIYGTEAQPSTFSMIRLEKLFIRIRMLF